MSLPSVATVPTGVDWKALRVARTMRFMAALYAFLPFQVSSATYRRVPWTVAI